ncbi:MAG: type VI secretion system contractile sheath domain-containing protein [Gemmatimonadaceae bacterium]
MRKGDPSYQVNLDVELGRDPHSRDESRSRDDVVFRLAICGDFSGRSGSTAETTGAPAAWRVDRDDFDDVIASVAPALHLALGSGVVAQVRIRELDDFHPDTLFDHVPQFAQLRELRSRLVDAATFKRAAADLSQPREAPTRPVTLPTRSVLDDIVGADAPLPSGGAAATSDLYAFIQHAMAPYLEARPDPRQAELIAQLDGTIAVVMRTLMHHASFQALESLWRGVFRLVRSVETSAQLQIHLIDVTRESLVADLLGADTAKDTTLYQRLNDRARPEHGGWSVLVAHYSFGGDAGDIAVLERLAALGAVLDAPWLAEGHPNLALAPATTESMVASWGRLRTGPTARYLGLSLPRVLLRLPYGKDSDAIERFAFEELEKPDAHGSYLWGNPAVVCAELLARGFSEGGPGLTFGASSHIDGLPLHLVRRSGETTTKPCAEVLMGENDAIALLEGGFMPMISYLDQGLVRVPRAQSIAEPAARLAGRMAR